MKVLNPEDFRDDRPVTPLDARVDPCPVTLEESSPRPRTRPWEYTLGEVGQVLGVSTERVRQIERTALAKCQQWCKRNGYRLEDLLERR